MSDDLIFRYPAKVLRPSKRQREELATRLADIGDPEILEDRQPFFWTAEISNNQVDFYSTWMMDSTLQNFVDDSIAGVGFLNSHRHGELPFGRSLSARMEDGDERNRVLTDFYTIPGLNLNGVSTDDLIAGMRSGIVSDVSVGFYGGEWWCDVCGGNYRDYQSCNHFAGTKVETKGGFVTVTVGIDGARLSEVSAVYDGATPDATILKAQRMAETGDLDPKLRETLEARYRTRLPERKIFAVADDPLAVTEGRTMDFEKVVNDVRSALGIGSDADLLATVAELTSQSQRLASVEADRDALAGKLQESEERNATLEAEAAELRSHAKDGKAYREDLINEALNEGVRAFGENFDNETYEATLRGASLAVIKRMKTDWSGIAQRNFSGGRQSVDESQAPSKTEKRTAAVPESAYRV